MTRFRFRLDRVLQLRARAEREQARALGDALREEAKRAEQVRDAESSLERSAEQIAEAGRTELPAGVLANLGFARHVAQVKCDVAKEDLDEAGRKVEEERGQFDEKRRDRRTIERLREQRHDEWQLDQSRQEQKETDGLNSGRSREGERS